MAEFNLRKLYRDVFGYEAPPDNPFTVPTATARVETSSLGQQYYAEDAFGREFFMPVHINDVLIPFAIISMNWKKTVVSTAMPERGGTVKELISIDDYVFNIKGICISEDNSFPEQQIIDLHELFKLNSSVKLRSALTAIVLNGKFEEHVVIKEIRWPEITAVEHVRAFEINAESDMIFELELK